MTFLNIPLTFLFSLLAKLSLNKIFLSVSRETYLGLSRGVLNTSRESLNKRYWDACIEIYVYIYIYIDTDANSAVCFPHIIMSSCYPVVKYIVVG